ncbi:chain A, Methionyl-Trna Formyltransferase From Clostridium Thermocellum [Candidatus Pelagibacter sp. HTCC7211]|uniref:formyltransferase family protein n=2 Tax=Pseudomonadota TaxID=1224 RepID=UPI000183A56F|nr:formyltransferase family protein [Candidatus Pelagibacter sp. HTCC7211]EDZ60986.1 chain A, Methionyl-Trna Formyltransferase From Clostridium Thermocellum [Candidatus Pelagibacter sp. HTCC7211]MBD1151147.1 methionyl-tRNA formyltransferase [Pelagibacterales bacterium SAG-MED25]
MSQIIIISKKKWDNSNYNLLKNNKEFILLDNINLKKINQVNPRIIFFIFWSKIIPKKVFSNFLCIQFHSSDLPKFKGGSPIQNQILKKIYKTKISAFKINNKIDSGDICMKSNISLTGKAENIYKNIEKKSLGMILKLSKKKKISFKKQTGKSSFYYRRNSYQSNLSYVINKKLVDIFDFIRMLDASNYPKAFYKLGNKKIELTDVSLNNQFVKGKFIIKKK